MVIISVTEVEIIKWDFFLLYQFASTTNKVISVMCVYISFCKSDLFFFFNVLLCLRPLVSCYFYFTEFLILFFPYLFSPILVHRYFFIYFLMCEYVCICIFSWFVWAICLEYLDALSAASLSWMLVCPGIHIRAIFLSCALIEFFILTVVLSGLNRFQRLDIAFGESVSTNHC